MTPAPETSAQPWTESPTARAGACCILFGLFLSVLPHFLWFQVSGTSAWIASNDELVCYYPVAAQALYNHPWHLADPAIAEGGVSMFPWIQFVPAVLATKLIGFGPFAVGFFWRLWAGASIGLGFYVLFLRFLKHPWLAAAFTCLLMADSGTIWGRPVVKHAVMALQMLQGEAPEWFFSSYPVLLLQWRLITPALSLFFLLLHVWLVDRAREQPTRSHLALAGCSLGALFYVYFYFWTAACAALALALALSWKQWRTWFHIGWIGVVTGAPALIQGMLAKRRFGDEWLQRTDKFVPIPHFSELLISKAAILVLAVSLVWIWKRRREWLHLWALSCAGFLLVNHQVVTGLQIENGHWGYVWGIGLSVLLLLMLGDALNTWWRQPVWRLAVYAVTGFIVVSGVWFRTLETTRSRETLGIQQDLARYREHHSLSNFPALPPNGVVAGAAAFQDFAGISDNQRPLERTAFLSAAISNDDWDRRVALNAYLSGETRERFERNQRAFFEQVRTGPWARHEDARHERITHRLQSFDAIQAAPAEAVEAYQVQCVAVPLDATAPSLLKEHWKIVQEGPYWQVWIRP